MWLADTAKYAVPHRFQYRIYARQAWVRLQDLNDVSAVADRYRLRKGKRRRNRSTTARCLARRSSALGERVVESAVGACRGEHGGLIGVECGVWTVGFTASDCELTVGDADLEPAHRPAVLRPTPTSAGFPPPRRSKKVIASTTERHQICAHHAHLRECHDDFVEALNAHRQGRQGNPLRDRAARTRRTRIRPAN